MAEPRAVASVLRASLGALALDVPRDLRALSSGARGYLRLRNRGDRLESSPHGLGFRCDWQWTRDLHSPRVLPWLGRRVFARALADRPIELRRDAPQTDGAPRVSFVIGHRGVEREPLLQATLASIAAQDIPVEAIVVEQSPRSEIGSRLPSWVRHIHTTVAEAAPYNRSWAFNVGAAHARTDVLVLHDNDLLVPIDYARCISEHVAQGDEVVNLKRFILYLGREDSERAIRDRALRACAPEAITQNAQGGASLALRADSFARIGGMDEGFVGWGGEDNEFWERCGTLRRWEFGYLSLVHLWHPSQPQKAHAENPTLQRYRALARIAPEERIRRLSEVTRGGASAREVDPFRDLMELA